MRLSIYNIRYLSVIFKTTFLNNVLALFIVQDRKSRNDLLMSNNEKRI